MKKILFVTESLNVGGMEKEQVILANTLAERGYDVSIILYTKSNTDNLEKQLDSKIHLLYKERKPLKIRRKLPYFHRFYRKDKWEKRASARTLYKYYVGSKKYDVEIAFYRGPSIKIVSGSTNRKSKKIAWVHTDFKLCDPKSIIKFFNNIEEVKAAYKKFDTIACVSNMAAESFKDVIGCEDKVQTIYNMISINDVKRKSKEDCSIEKEKLTFVTTGRFVEAKGYERLLKVVNRLRDEGFDFDIWFVGDGRDEEKLKKYVEEKKLVNVKFLGYQENPYAYMAKADVFVCSSIREGFSLVVVEAMACGLPIISTKCTGPTEILDNGKYGVLVDNSEDALYIGLKNAILFPSSFRDFKEKSINRCDYFDKNKIINQIVEIIEN